MPKTATIAVRIDEGLKERAQDALDKMGLPMSLAVEMFLRQVAEKGKLPFAIGPEGPSLEELAQRAQYSGLPADYFQQNRDQILGEAANSAVRRVRLSYILLGIAKEEGLEVSEDEVMAGLEKMAATSGGKTTAADLRKQIEENGQISAYREQLAAEKALDFVLSAAK